MLILTFRPATLRCPPCVCLGVWVCVCWCFMVTLYNFKLAFAAAAEKYAIEIATAQQASKVQRGSLCPTVDYRVMSTAFGVDAAVSAGVGLGVAVAVAGVGGRYNADDRCCDAALPGKFINGQLKWQQQQHAAKRMRKNM